ncbi:MAG: hypothetical protein K9M45_04620 [Kiritimatiellales bacterium]|nr:hypothetical protein [Kiritimatiellales bacterium]
MNYSKDQLDTAIDHTGLQERHRSSLRGLVAIRRQPLFLGYIVQILGVLLLVLSGYFMYLMIRVVSFHSDLPPSELSKSLEPFGKVAVMCFLLSLFLLNGAGQYLERARQSRALCELLMKENAANHISDGIRQTADGSPKPSM